MRELTAKGKQIRRDTREIDPDARQTAALPTEHRYGVIRGSALAVRSPAQSASRCTGLASIPRLGCCSRSRAACATA
jgi:hypothetical protein